LEKVKLNDFELVQRFVNGDNSAVEKLISHHKNRVYTYIFLIVKNEALAEDIFQETFIKVIRSLKSGRYSDSGKFISWVLRIAHNLIIDHYRKEKYLNTISNDDSEIDLFNSPRFSDTNFEEVSIQNQIHSDIHKLMEMLPEDQKQVVFMRHFQDLSFREIAEQTDVSINTALGRMRYALINLRKMVAERNMDLTRS